MFTSNIFRVKENWLEISDQSKVLMENANFSHIVQFRWTNPYAAVRQASVHGRGLEEQSQREGSARGVQESFPREYIILACTEQNLNQIKLGIYRVLLVV